MTFFAVVLCMQLKIFSALVAHVKCLSGVFSHAFAEVIQNVKRSTGDLLNVMSTAIVS